MATPAEAAAQATTNEQLAAVNQYTFFGFMGICSIGVMRPELMFKSLIPGIMAGILGIYGLIVSVIYISAITETTDMKGAPSYTPYKGYKHLAGGMCCGLSALGAGITIGIVGDAGVRANAQKDIYVGMILILIFAEALGLYGLIVAIIMNS